jgi:protein gp37
VSSKSSIEWTDATWNPVSGCSKVSPGCAHCYAERLSLRFGTSKKQWLPEHAAENVQPHPDRLGLPLTWRKPRMVFVNSISDLFHELVPDDFIDQVFGVMALAERHTFQVLTKRPERMREYMRATGRRELWAVEALRFHERHNTANGLGVVEGIRGGWRGPFPNVWLGVSAENQYWANDRIPILLDTPAAVRFVSAEPLLGPIDFVRLGPMEDGNGGALAPDALAGGWWQRRGRVERWIQREKGPHLDWVIVGGESGPVRRPALIPWVQTIRDQCIAASVPFFFKQWGGRTPKALGRDLDGRTWDEMPARVLA